uniref:ADP ribosylation factor like GTPase 10 n=1 Tax=Phasianus colchicus TaxID=9054 RepID=A0A669PSN9_PHACC
MAPTGVLRNLTLVLGAAVVVLGSLLFIAWKLYFRGTEPAGTWDGWELRELQDSPALSCCPQAVWKQVLVLGLDGAGKSSVLHYICSQKARTRISPTLGFNTAQLRVGGLEMDLLEVGGSYNLRAYWPLYLSDAHVLVFVVDSVDRSRLLTARQELHALLAEEPRLPLVVLANKQVAAPQNTELMGLNPEAQSSVKPQGSSWKAGAIPSPAVMAVGSGFMMPLPPAGHPGADVADAAPSLLTQKEISPLCLPRI